AVCIQCPVQMRSRGSPTRSYVADHIALFHLLTFLHGEFRQVQVYRFQALAVIDPDCSSAQRKPVRNLHHATCNSMHGTTKSASLVEPRVVFTSRLAIVQTRYSEWRSQASR